MSTQGSRCRPEREVLSTSGYNGPLSLTGFNPGVDLGNLRSRVQGYWRASGGPLTMGSAPVECRVCPPLCLPLLIGFPVSSIHDLPKLPRVVFSTAETPTPITRCPPEIGEMSLRIGFPDRFGPGSLRNPTAEAKAEDSRGKAATRNSGPQNKDVPAQPKNGSI